MTEQPKVYRVLFLCTANSARSIMAEAILNMQGKGRFMAVSAGVNPAGVVHPSAINLLKQKRIPTGGLRSKSWKEFQSPEKRDFDFVFSVCGQAAEEICPIWPGQPLNAHWEISDPVTVTGTPAETAAAYSEAFRMLNQRISIFVSLPFEALDRMALQRRLDDIEHLSRTQDLPVGEALDLSAPDAEVALADS